MWPARLKHIWQSSYLSLAVLLLGILSFNNWILGYWLDRQLLLKGGSVSELSVVGQPHAWLFRAMDVFSGAMFVVLASLLAKKMTAGRGKNLLLITMVVLGVANIFDAALPLNCSETLSSSCSVPVSFSWSHVTIPSHGYSSVVIGLTYFVLPLAGLVYARAQRVANLLKVVSLVAIVAALASFISAINTYLMHHSVTVQADGHNQEFQMLLLGVWFLACYKSLRFAPKQS